MKPRMQQVLIGGFAATILMTLMMYYVAPLMLGGPMDIAAMLADMIGTSWLAGITVHILLGGLAFPLVFHALYPVLPGGGWLKGLTYGMILAVLALVVVMPMAGMGVFMANHPQPAMAVMGSLMGHALYGIVLGWWSGKSVGSEAVQASV